MKDLRPYIWIAVLPLLFPALLAVAEVPNDFDGDGVSDFVFTTLGSDGTLIWKALLSSSGEEKSISSGFGVSGDITVTGYWRTPETPPGIALLRYDPVGKTLEWKMQLESSLITNREFGNGSSFAAAGADFDGDGLGDAAVVRQKGHYWRWSIKTKLFADSGSTVRKVTFGKIKDRVFYMNPGGASDRIATFGTCSKKYACVRMAAFPDWKKTTLGRFPRALATRYGRPRPVPVKQADGADALAFITEGKGERRVRVYTRNGRTVADVSVAHPGLFAVGDYLPETAGEEIAFQSGSSIQILNPFTSTLVTRNNVSGNLVEGRLAAALVAATPTAVPTTVPTTTPTSVSVQGAASN